MGFMTWLEMSFNGHRLRYLQIRLGGFSKVVLGMMKGGFVEAQLGMLDLRRVVIFLLDFDVSASTSKLETGMSIADLSEGRFCLTKRTMVVFQFLSLSAPEPL